MKKIFVFLIAITAAGGAAGCANAQTNVTCSRLCWSPLVPTENSSFTCFVKIDNQTQQDTYNKNYNSGAFNGGRKAFFFALPNGDKVSCGNTSSVRPIAVLGKIYLTLTAKASGPTSIGKTEDLVGGSYTFDYQNTLFFPDPSQE